MAIDGGGVRGLVSLLILRRLMHLISPKDPPKPCQVFDVIAGTSTGGLIAIMLGRLVSFVAVFLLNSSYLQQGNGHRRMHLCIHQPVQGCLHAPEKNEGVWSHSSRANGTSCIRSQSARARVETSHRTSPRK